MPARSAGEPGVTVRTCGVSSGPTPMSHISFGSPKRSGTVVRRGTRETTSRAAALEGVLLAEHLHGAAHRNRREAVLGLPAAPAEQDGPEADREALDPHPHPAGDEEVAELVDQDEEADDDDERHDRDHAAG